MPKMKTKTAAAQRVRKAARKRRALKRDDVLQTAQAKKMKGLLG